jgi:dihydrolipoamide dehydrogenase
VTVVEMLDRILPVEDAEVSAFMDAALKKRGMDIRAKTGVQKITATDTGLTAEIKGADGDVTIEEFSHVIVAVGIVPNLEDIGLEALNIARDERGHIKTDRACRTNVESIYAIGDVTEGPWLAHKASHEGVIAVEPIAGGHPHAMDPRNIPDCTYCHPQVASVGLTEAKAKEAGYKIKVGKFPFMGNGKAIALGEAEGFIKTVFDEATGELLGAHMVGAEVTELIQSYVVGKTLETTENQPMNTVFAHPTLSEMLHESILAAYGRALHM